MELIITITALTISVITNYIVVRSLKSLRSNEAELFTATLETFEGCGCDCASKIEEAIKVFIVKEEPVPTVKEDNEAHRAWKNVVYEPVKAPPSPHGPPPVSGPLERPYGFTR